MSRSPISVQPLPRSCRALLRFLGLSAVLLCAAVCRPPAAPRTNPAPPPLEKEIHVGEVHTYPIELQAGQSLRVIAEEYGVNLTLKLFAPDGTVVTGANGLLAGHEKEEISVVAETSGGFRLEIEATAGPERRYRLQIDAPREAREEDRLRAEAVRALWIGLNGPFPNSDEGRRQQISVLEPALALWEQLREPRQSAEALVVLGRKRRLLTDYARAAEDYRRAAALWGSQPDRQARIWQALCLNGAGLSLKLAERREEARKSYEEALAVAREVDDDVQQASILTNLGNLDAEDGELLRGMEYQREALERSRRAGDRATETKILNNLAYTFEELGEHQKALELYQQYLALARERSDQDEVATALNNLANTYGSLGDWEKALDHYQQALELNRASGNRAHEAKTLNNLGVTYRHLDRFDEAWEAFNQAIEAGRKDNDFEAQFFVFSNQASLSLRQKQPARAIELARQALPLARGLSEREASLSLVLGNAYRDLGDLETAREELEKALALFQRRGDRGGEAEARLALARLHREKGDLTATLTILKPAIEIIESLRAKVVSQELRASFLAAKQDYYELQIDTLMALHQRRETEGLAAAALQVSERARARSLLEILREAGADIRQGAAPDLLERERRLRDEVNARELFRLDLLAAETPDETKLAEAERKLEEVLQEYQRVQAQLRESSPRYASLTQPQPLSVAEIQGQVLAEGGLLLEYSLGEKRSFLWAIGPDSFTSFELPAREVIEERARRYYDRLTVRNNPLPGEKPPEHKKRTAQADAEAERVARDLSRLILKPVEPLLGKATLLIVADGALQYIPFAALPIPGSQAILASRHEVVHLPSASTLAVLRDELRDRQRAPSAVAIFADPVFQKDDERLLTGGDTTGGTKLTPAPATPGDGEQSREAGFDLSRLSRLPFSGTEAEAIAALVPADQVLKAVGFEATRVAVASTRLQDYQNVHFATHGVLDSERPDLSALVLSLYDRQGERLEDGFLRLNDIYNFRLNADLVVLSACETALGKEIRGEGLVGLTRGFMYAGAARVLASLWSIEDQATAELMASFYRGMLREKLSPPAALRKAQLQIAAKPRWKSPYFWAGFSLQGEWR